MLPQASSSVLHSGRNSTATCNNEHNILYSAARQYATCRQRADRCSCQHQHRIAVQASAAPRRTAPGMTKDEPVAVPPPSNMQASVTLVPKKNASTALLQQAATPTDDAIGKFLLKCKLAWNLFFPPQSEDSAAAPTPNLSPKELGKQRLQMILVADRCGLSPSSLVEMKRNTLAALSECMELEDLQDAHLRFTMTREGGTTYSMAVPILRAGPYAEDGSVVGQQAANNAAMAAAAAAAGFAYDDDAYDDEDQDMYDIEYATDAEYQDAPTSAAEEYGAQEDPQQQSLQPQQQLLQVQEDSSDALTPVAVAATVTTDNNSSSNQDDVGAFKEQLKELLVEELVHDVEDLALHGDGNSSSSAVLHTEAANGDAEIVVALPPGVVVDGAGGVMSEQKLREKAEQEVTRLLVKESAEEGDAAGASGQQQGV